MGRGRKERRVGGGVGSRRHFSISLSREDAILLEELRGLMGAYTLSEVVRDALRRVRGLYGDTYIKSGGDDGTMAAD